jgi:hypothetical protein
MPGSQSRGEKRAAVKKDMVKANNGGSTRAAHAPCSIAAFVGGFFRRGSYRAQNPGTAHARRRQSNIRENTV